MTPNDLLPTPEVVQLLKEEGIDIKYHRSRPVNDELIRQADLVLGFTAIHVQTCLRRVPESKPKTFLLKDYAGLGQSGDQIHDPMGSTMEIFKKYFTEIKQSLQKLVESEFVTTPPEPKEVVIAASVSKPRQTDDEDDIMSDRRDDSRRAKTKRTTKPEESAQEPSGIIESSVRQISSKTLDINASEASATEKLPAKGKKAIKPEPSIKAAPAKKTGVNGKAPAKKVQDEASAETTQMAQSTPAAKKAKPAGTPKVKADIVEEQDKPEKKQSKSAAKTTTVAKTKDKAAPKATAVNGAAKQKKSVR